MGQRRLVALAALSLLLVSSVAARSAASGTVDTSGDPLLDARPFCGEQAPTLGSTPTDSHVRGLLTDDLHVTTYNILHGQGQHANLLGHRIPLIIDTLIEADADAIGLQEVVGPFDTATNEPDPAAEYVPAQIAQRLADAYGETWEWCWFESNPHFPGEPDLQEGGGGGPLTETMIGFNPTAPGMREGLAILSRFDIEKSRARRLLRGRAYEAPFCDPVEAVDAPLGCPAESVFDHRQILWARIVRPDDAGTFDLFTTHLAHGITNVSQATKRLQVELALHTIDEWADPGTPTFFVGDFNSTEDGQDEIDRYGRIRDAGFVDTFRKAHTNDPGFTADVEFFNASGTQPTVNERIDFVWLRPNAGCNLSVPASRVIGTTPVAFTNPHTTPPTAGYLWPSDHFGVASATRC